MEMPNGAWPLIPDVAKLTEAVEKELSSDKSYSTLLDEMKAAKKNASNIEEILSFIRSLKEVSKGGTVRGFSEDALGEMEVAVCNAIVAKINVQLPNQETPYHRLCNWIRSIDRKQAIEIFTTNYDLLIEQSLEDNEIPYFDGFVGSRRSFFDLRALEDNLIPKHWARLWKIHGSINWYLDESSKQKKIYRSSEVKEKTTAHLIYPSHLKYQESRKMPYLALIDQLNRFLRKKSSFLVISGYSFNDEHINDTIFSALRANPTAMALGLMFGSYRIDGAADRYPIAYELAKKQHNLNIWTNDIAIIGTNTDAWAIPNPQNDADSDLMPYIKTQQANDSPLSTAALVELGDFNEFSHFLKKTIGAKSEK